jgi:hypothetical protein
MLSYLLVVAEPSEGAVSNIRYAATTDHRAPDSQSCLDTRVLKEGRVSLYVPMCWALSRYTDASTMVAVVAYLSNQAMHNPCFTKRSGATTDYGCKFPIKKLEPGGALVMLMDGGIPGWKISDVSGKRLEVDHHPSRESVDSPTSRLRATQEIQIFITTRIGDDYFEIAAYYRNPGLKNDRRLLQKVVSSIRIAPN